MAKGLWVVLNVDNVDKSVEFYKGLGLKAGTESQEGLSWGTVFTSSPDAGLILWNKNVVAPAQPEDTRAWLSGELGKGVVVALGVPNAVKLWEKAEAARITIDQPLRAQEWGGHEFTFVDPDGYLVNVTDKFPGAPPKRSAKKATKRLAKKAKAATRKVARKAKRR
ncbi:MAG TPA: VOC family protein [Candidatus Thermoplasmatota archaeon]|nr:VOC family protein [Candidatus Thermoplasmatota archaeon]